MLEKAPARILRRAVRGMLPKNSMRDVRLKRLKLFIGETPHPHSSQIGQLPPKQVEALEGDVDDGAGTDSNETYEFFHEYVARKGLTPADWPNDPDMAKATEEAILKNTKRAEFEAKQQALDAIAAKKVTNLFLV